jgi:PAS domain S-box-containing protein
MVKKPNSYSSTVVGDNIESAQQSLCEREHLLRVLTDHVPGHIAYVGANDLRYQFVNQNFESSFGRPRKEIIGKHIKKIIGESNYDYALKYIAEVRAGKSTSYLNVFNLAQGRRWIKVNYVPDLDEQINQGVGQSLMADQKWKRQSRIALPFIYTNCAIIYSPRV